MNQDHQALACSDWTTLTFAEREGDMEAMMERVESLEGGPAACCIPLDWVEWWAERRGRRDVKLATVLNFPLGQIGAEALAAEAERAAAAEEWDVVFPHASFRRGDEGPARELLPLVRAWAGERTVKVILETGAPWDRRALQRAAAWSLEAGADFLKTSTGKVPVGATPESTGALIDVLQGTGCGLKVSGGIRTIEAARSFMDQAAAALGEPFIHPATFRIGTSALLLP